MLTVNSALHERDGLALKRELATDPKAWKRVVRWVRGGAIDVPDRPPYEVLAPLYGERSQAHNRAIAREDEA